jgi:hypothetical protein
MTNQTIETVNEIGFELMEYSPYSPDLASSDVHVFSPMKEALRGRFPSDEKVIGAVQIWLKTQPPPPRKLTELKNLKNARTGALKSRGITLKSNISFVSVYLQ